MVNLAELKNKFQNLENRVKNIYEKKKIAELKNQKIELDKISSESNFWENSEKAKEIMQKIGLISKEIEEIESLTKALENIRIFLEDEKSILDEDIYNLVKDSINSLEKEINRLEIVTFLSGKFDNCNVIMKITAGQGGTEACDWVSMLFRMYFQYIQSKNWEINILNKITGNEAGFSQIEFEVKGKYVYGLLKHEHGTHRLVRNSPFNAQGLRQTSFAGVEIIPIIEHNIDIEIKESDIEFSAVRSSGAGGQNVNKVSSKVRIVHKPTGIVVECDSERSQAKNKDIAMKILKSKLYFLEEQKKQQEIQSIKGEHKIAGWGNQIRNYILQPYQLVKDLRTNIESYDAYSVLNGDLENFIDAEVRLLS